nr:MAG TPA: hypothetical protein [Caudoviricetes sp.]
MKPIALAPPPSLSTSLRSFFIARLSFLISRLVFTSGAPNCYAKCDYPAD